MIPNENENHPSLFNISKRFMNLKKKISNIVKIVQKIKGELQIQLFFRDYGKTQQYSRKKYKILFLIYLILC